MMGTLSNRTIEKVEVIEIKWEGPLSLEEVAGMAGAVDYGVYQVYGTHVVFGSDALLYIGKAEQQRFATRFNQHLPWLGNEHSSLSYYLGRLGGTDPCIHHGVWSRAIDHAERLLIHECSPPYNSQHIGSFNRTDQGEHDFMVLNFGKRHRIPAVLTTAFRGSAFWNTAHWEVFKE